MRVIFALTLFFFVFALDLSGQSKSEFLEIKNKYEKIRSQTGSAQKKLDVYRAEIRHSRDYIRRLENQIKSLNNEFNYNQKAFKNVEKELNETKKHYKKLLFYAYKTRHLRKSGSYFWSAKDYNTAYQRFIYVRFISEYLQNATDKMKNLSDSLRYLNKEIQRSKRSKLAKAEELGERTIELENEIEAQKRYVRKLQSKKSVLRRQLNKKRKRNKALQTELVKNTKSEKSRKPVRGTSAFASKKGKLSKPVNGVITSGFGEHRHSVLENVTVRNDGIDFTCTASENVYAVASGKVSKILEIPAYNKVVILKHGDYFSVYSNLSNVSVRVGQKVSEKQKLGNVFYNPGENHSGLLNFQIWKNNTKLNPQTWLR